MNTSLAVFVLLVAFEVKHFVADYPFQSAYHAGKIDVSGLFVPPILLHAFFHALLTAGIATLFLALTHHIVIGVVLGLAFIDFAIHYSVDHHSLALMKPQRGPQFWWWIGLDEMAHRLTNILIVYLLTL